MSIAIKFVLVLAALACLANAQQREDKIIIDAYGIDSSIFFVTPTNFNGGADIPCGTSTSDCTSRALSVVDATALGGERDFFLQAESGQQKVFSTATGPFGNGNDQAWTSSTANAASGFSTLVYDGVDGSEVIDVNGLDTSLTGNLADSFEINLSTDIDSLLTITVYEGGDVCVLGPINVPGQPDVLQEVEFGFGDFTNNCDFSDVGAIEILVEMFANVDILVTKFATRGDVPVTPTPTPTATPTNSPAPTESRTPTGTPSQTPGPPSPSSTGTSTPAPTPPPSVSRTPSRTPTPVIEVCDCNCPTFFCGLVYAVPRDDDDGIDDEWFDDDNDVVYRPVYYEPVDDDFLGKVGTDDHDNISFEGGLTRGHNDDDDDSTPSSGASTIAASVAVLAVSAAVMLLA